MIDPGHDRRLVVRTRRDEVHVSPRYDGVVAEELAHEGDLVATGDLLARLYSEGSA